MRFHHAFLALVSLFLGTLGLAFAADGHRVVVLDIGRWPNGRAGSNQYQLLVLDIDSGKTLAKREIGFNTDIDLSPKGDVLSAISYYGGPGGGESRLEFFRAHDLKPLEKGGFPSSIRRIATQLGPNRTSRTLPDQKEMIVQSMELSPGGVAQNATTLLTTVKRELDKDGVFKRTSREVQVPRSYGVRILRVSDWPKVQIWVGYPALLEVVDFETGKILSRLPIADDPLLEKMDPLKIEKDQHLLYRIKGQGSVIAGDGRYAYFVPYPPPRGPGVAPPPPKPGYLRKIDLAAQPPKVIGKGEEPQPDLGSGIVSEAAGKLFIVQDKRNEEPNNAPSNRIKVFGTKDLKLEKEIRLSINECEILSASRDGKLLYALDPESAKLAVIDVATGKEIKVLDKLGTYPEVILPLPEERP